MRLDDVYTPTVPNKSDPNTITFKLNLYRATRERSYLEKAEMMYRNFFLTSSWAFFWDDKTAGVQLLLYGVTKKPAYGQAIHKYLRNWLPGNPTS